MAAEEATNAGAWIALTGALGGALLTGILALSTQGLQEKWAHRRNVHDFNKQLRQERREAFIQYIDAWENLNEKIRHIIATGAPAWHVYPPGDLASNNPGAEPWETVDDDEWTIPAELAVEVRTAEAIWRQVSSKAIVSSGAAVQDLLIVHADQTRKLLSDAHEGRSGSFDGENHKKLYNAMGTEIQTLPGAS